MASWLSPCLPSCRRVLAVAVAATAAQAARELPARRQGFDREEVLLHHSL